MLQNPKLQQVILSEDLKPRPNPCSLNRHALEAPLIYIGRHALLNNNHKSRKNGACCCTMSHGAQIGLMMQSQSVTEILHMRRDPHDARQCLQGWITVLAVVWASAKRSGFNVQCPGPISYGQADSIPQRQEQMCRTRPLVPMPQASEILCTMSLAE